MRCSFLLLSFIVICNAQFHMVNYWFSNASYDGESKSNSEENYGDNEKLGTTIKPNFYSEVSKATISQSSKYFPATDGVSSVSQESPQSSASSNFPVTETSTLFSNQTSSIPSTHYPENETSIQSRTSIIIETTTPSDIPETSTDETLPTWQINTTIPETTIIPTPAPPKPFVAAFNTSCIAAVTLNVSADTVETNQLAFRPPPYSGVTGSCNVKEQSIRINTTVRLAMNDSREMFLVLNFVMTSDNSYKMDRVEFLMPNESHSYERYTNFTPPYMVDVPIGKSYRCNFSTIFQMYHEHLDRRDMNLTFKEIWIEAFRTNLYQEMGPAVDCQLTSNMLVHVITVLIILGLVLVLGYVLKVYTKKCRQRLWGDCRGYGILEESERPRYDRGRKYSADLERAMIPEEERFGKRSTEGEDPTTEESLEDGKITTEEEQSSAEERMQKAYEDIQKDVSEEFEKAAQVVGNDPNEEIETEADNLEKEVEERMVDSKPSTTTSESTD